MRTQSVSNIVDAVENLDRYLEGSVTDYLYDLFGHDVKLFDDMSKIEQKMIKIIQKHIKNMLLAGEIRDKSVIKILKEIVEKNYYD